MTEGTAPGVPLARCLAYVCQTRPLRGLNPSTLRSVGFLFVTLLCVTGKKYVQLDEWGKALGLSFFVTSGASDNFFAPPNMA